MDKRALLIAWDPSTGERAGNINPRDPKLQCNGWQNMDVTPAIELRLVNDDRDLSIYDEIPGVTALTGTDTINETITANFPPKLKVEDELIYSEHFKSKRGKIDIDTLPDDITERLKVLKSVHGVKGIRETKPVMV